MTKSIGQAVSAEPLSWDSEHFGFSVARLPGALEDGDLQAALTLARANGHRLVYWPAQPGRAVPSGILADFGGQLVDRKVRFGVTLSAVRPAPPCGFHIAEYPKGPASERLTELALLAGWSSRYAVDARFPREKFQLLYETWIRRSTTRDIAGMVFVAQAPTDREPVGMITLSSNDGIGKIGLIAVLDLFHGHGVAPALMQAGHKWMQDHEATHSTVVTQMQNTGACELYKRFGYDIEELQDFYHFWVA